MQETMQNEIAMKKMEEQEKKALEELNFNKFCGKEKKYLIGRKNTKIK